MSELVNSSMRQLLDAYATHGIDVRGHLRPGASDREIAAVGEAIGLPVPDELRALYRFTAGPTIDYGDVRRLGRPARWDPYGDTPNREEIWRRHNPAVVPHLF